MNLISFARRVAAAAVVFGTAGVSAAADKPVAAPTVLTAVAPCQTCAAPAGAPCGPTCTAAKPGCPTWIPGRVKTPYQTKLCPGACFGYFQTQWSKWDDVCPLPYQGQGFTDAPATRTTPVTPVRAPVTPVVPVAPATADPKKMPEVKGLDPKFNKDGKPGELLPPRPAGTGTIPMPVGRGVPPIPQVPGGLPVPTGRFGS